MALIYSLEITFPFSKHLTNLKLKVVGSVIKFSEIIKKLV